ncbi:hypothetical protein GCWU000341_01484 [Oribacterium sp. oral taxon 078 str. F0262]|nr:hypothetical protein GCWU000341_01484 [Oribacterium sp. oral taxon 078 str. F0262]
MGFTLGKMLDAAFKRADIFPQRSQYSRSPSGRHFSSRSGQGRSESA